MSRILHLIFSLVFFNISLNVGAQDSNSLNLDCPEDFQRLGDKCYKMERTKKNWYQAELDCRLLNAELVTIENENEMNVINNYIIAANIASRWFWTSANDLAEEGRFHWQSNGKPMSYNRFTTGEPNNLRSREHCVHLMYATENNRNQIEMNDNQCEKQLMSICESKVIDLDDNVNNDLIDSALDKFLSNNNIANGENLPYISYKLD